MSDELRAAAERLRRYYSGPPQSTKEYALGQEVCDLRTLADAYLAERDYVSELESLAIRVVEIFRPMQDKGQNGHTFELLLRRAERLLDRKAGDAKMTGPGAETPDP